MEIIMTNKERAVAELARSGLSADSSSGVVKVNASPEDKDARRKVEEVFKKIGYNESWGMCAKGVKGPEEVRRADPAKAEESGELDAEEGVAISYGGESEEGQMSFDFG